MTIEAETKPLTEAVAPVPRDDVPDKADDLALCEAGGVQHVAK
jgi:hypothetical protein